MVTNSPHNTQPLGVLPRPATVGGAMVDHSCSQAVCHNPKNAAGALQTPAGDRDLTSSFSNDVPQELSSYRQLLFPHNTVIMGAPGPAVGPYLNAGSAHGALLAQVL